MVNLDKYLVKKLNILLSMFTLMIDLNIHFYHYEMYCLWYYLAYFSDEGRLGLQLLNILDLSQYFLSYYSKKAQNRSFICNRGFTDHVLNTADCIYRASDGSLGYLKPMSFTPGRKLKNMSLKFKKRNLSKTQNQVSWR